MSKERVMVFPGQGSQEVGMGEDVYFSTESLWLGADKVLKALGWNQALIEYCHHAGIEMVSQNVEELCFKGPKEVLDLTRWTQPALLVASSAYDRAVREKGVIEPVAVTGHSFAEITALVAAGVLTLEDAVKLAMTRGFLMAKAGEENPGKMVVILGQELEAIERRITEKGVEKRVFIANINCPGQTVLSGYEQDVLGFARGFTDEIGERYVRVLPVSIASHCPLMQTVADGLAAFIREEKIQFNRPQIPFYSPTAFSVEGIENPVEDPKQIEGLVVDCPIRPVRWQDAVEQMIAAGYAHFVEVGPGNVLQGLIKRIDKNVTVDSVRDYL